MFDRCASDHVCKHYGEVFKSNNGCSARIIKLILQLTRCAQPVHLYACKNARNVASTDTANCGIFSSMMATRALGVDPRR